MKTLRIRTRATATAMIVAVTLLTSGGGNLAATPTAFCQQTNLVSDQPGVALIQDPTLVNPWGIALNATGGAFWVANNGSGTSTLYTGDAMACSDCCGS